MKKADEKVMAAVRAYLNGTEVEGSDMMRKAGVKTGEVTARAAKETLSATKKGLHITVGLLGRVVNGAADAVENAVEQAKEASEARKLAKKVARAQEIADILNAFAALQQEEGQKK